MAELSLILLLLWILGFFNKGKKKKSNSEYRNKNSEDDDLFSTDLGDFDDDFRL